MKLLPLLALLALLQPFALGVPIPADKPPKSGKGSGSGAKPAAPGTKPTAASVAKPTTPVIKATAPATKPATPVTKPTTSVAGPATSGTKPTASGASPATASGSAPVLGSSRKNPVPDPRAAVWDAFRPAAPNLGIQKDFQIDLERSEQYPRKELRLTTSFSGYIRVAAGVKVDDHAVLSYYAYAAMRQMQGAHKNHPNAMIAMAAPDNRILLASSFSIPGLFSGVAEADKKAMERHGNKAVAEVSGTEKGTVGNYLVACLDDPDNPRRHRAGGKCGEINVLRLDREIKKKEAEQKGGAAAAAFTYDRPKRPKIAAWVKKSVEQVDGKWVQVEGIDDPCADAKDIPGQYGCRELAAEFGLDAAPVGTRPGDLSKVFAQEQNRVVTPLPNPRKADSGRSARPPKAS